MGLSSKAMLVFVLLAASLAAINGNGEGRTIVVGGSQGWRSSVNYTDWTIRNSPFYINDRLGMIHQVRGTLQSVYLMQSLSSYGSCDLKGAKLLANPRQGRGEGFTFVVDQWKVHYFASGGGNGKSCEAEMMKFTVVPWPRPSE
ncbi:putative Lamin-like protein [Tripterygium wilfordii]|uniref:Putative Lamin-like protein n=1 Tax=Tripterygium wilfordii TaxID=458696 RepID=A0A7J7D303_TRIWF|nr:putative Lamin-like protein [Tripterygium wilfordii]